MRGTIALVFAVLLFSCQPMAEYQLGQQSYGEVLAENLDTPWAIDFLPDGTMIFTERGGHVYLLQDELRQVGSIDVHELGESGLHGVAVDPDFEDNRFVYLYYTYRDGNRVSRFTLNEELENEVVLLEGIPNARFHDGGGVKFGPDNKLYITTGDATNPSSAQDMDSLAGKVLRMNKDGTVPEDNPFGNLVYSYGHRNPQGITWNDTVMYAVEHGPRRYDEVNLIEKGGNYGWPEICGEDPDAIEPIRCYTEFTLAPGGIAWADALYVAGLRGEQLRRLDIENGKVINEEVLVDGIGRIREVVAHNGYFYIATSNRDGRGNPAINDDKIIMFEIS